MRVYIEGCFRTSEHNGKLKKFKAPHKINYGKDKRFKFFECVFCRKMYDELKKELRNEN